MHDKTLSNDVNILLQNLSSTNLRFLKLPVSV